MECRADAPALTSSRQQACRQRTAAVTIEQVDLSRYELLGALGSGADYQVRAALDKETGREVALKRPQPQMVSKRLHGRIEARTDRTLEILQNLDFEVPTAVRVLGYTSRANHDAYFGDLLGQEYRVVVEERAKGIPLVGDPMARIIKVPTGVGQNLFTLFPIVQPKEQPPFPIHRQLLDMEERLNDAGYVLLDLRPQNIFYQPAEGRITVIDHGDLRALDDLSYDGLRPPPEIHQFYMEMLKFYTTPEGPPGEAQGYREPYGLRRVLRFELELEGMADRFANAPSVIQDAALPMIGKVRQREYSCFTDFRGDLNEYLEAVTEYDLGLANLPELRQAWMEALGWLGEEYWQRYLFDYEAEAAAFQG